MEYVKKKMEIKVLSKTFDLLELIRERFPETLLPGEAAEILGIPRSTCVRLLKLLTAEGYLEQLSPRKGYSVGPVLYLLGSGECYHQHLTVHAKILLESLSKEHNCSMQFFMRRGECRLILCGFNGDKFLNLEQRKIRRYDLNTSISGRMLLSFAPQEEQKAIIDSWGENRGVFQGMTEEEILEKLSTMKTLPFLIDSHRGKFAAAVPLRGRGETNMGIGAVWREENDFRRQDIVAALENCAAKLSDIIAVENFG